VSWIGWELVPDLTGRRALSGWVLLAFLMTFLTTRAIRADRPVLGVIGVFVPLLALIAALRLARPGSPWARRRYPLGSPRLARSRERFPPGRRSRWDPLRSPASTVPADATAAEELRHPP
jgi:hypothetical protein